MREWPFVLILHALEQRARLCTRRSFTPSTFGAVGEPLSVLDHFELAPYLKELNVSTKSKILGAFSKTPQGWISADSGVLAPLEEQRKVKNPVRTLALWRSKK